MATKYWEPKATAVAQVTTVQVTANDAATTYKLTVNGLDVSTAGNAGGATATASDLADAWNASTLSYFSGITAANNASDTVTLTADAAGLPFTVTSSATGGTGTIGSPSTTTAATGPNFWDNADNWSSGAVPVNGDDVYISAGNVSILWGLDQSSVALTSLRIGKAYTGRIGLNAAEFVTVAAGGTVDTTLPEYRDAYLQIGATTCTIGKHTGQDNPAGSGRILIDFGSSAVNVTVFDGAQVSTDTGKPSIRLLTNSTSAELHVRRCQGGVGLAVDVPGETSTIDVVEISDTSTASRVQAGPGVTINSSWQQTGGVNVLQAAATVAAVTVKGGTLTTEGDYTITALDVYSGTVNQNHVKTAGNCVTTLSLYGGTVTTQGSSEARTIATLALHTPGGTFVSDGSVVTVTSVTEPASVRYTLQIAAQN